MGKPSTMFTVPTVHALRALAPPSRQAASESITVRVEGWSKPGDAGAKLVAWHPDCTDSDNGGTIHAPADGSSGRWKTVHDGTGHYRWFGIFGPDKPADDALDAMIGDESIIRIEADSDLRFIRRHSFGRSRITLDFNHYAVYTDGIEDAPDNDPFAAVLLFRGELTGEAQSLKLTEPLEELDERFEVADSSAFAVGEWWIAQSDELTGRAERELDKLVQVTEIIDERHVRFNYKNGWRLEAGREVRFKKVKPVVGASVRNMKFYGAGTTMATGSHPLAYEFAVECDASGIDACGVFWPVVMRRYNTFYVTERCKLTNPVEVLIGGTGYMTQQIYCLYGEVRNCQTSNGRHLNDFTGSAYCSVTNCHADGDDLGAFVTHGQYEHDLVYTGNSGLISFANSGPTWGESAKRITVRQHVASWFIAHRKVTDLTLEDVHVFKRHGVENADNTGAIWLNADGVQMKNCTAEAMVKFVQVSARSSRPNVAENCSFAVTQGRRLSHEEVEAALVFRGCRFRGLDGNRFAGSGELRFIDCELEGAGPDSAMLSVAAKSIGFKGGSMRETGIKLVGEGDKRITVDGGASLSGTNAEKALLKRETAANSASTTEWKLFGATSRAADADTSHVELEGAGHRFEASGVSFEGGRFRIGGRAFADGGYMLHAGNVERSVDRSEMPAENARIRNRDGNLILD